MDRARDLEAGAVAVFFVCFFVCLFCFCLEVRFFFFLFFLPFISSSSPPQKAQLLDLFQPSLSPGVHPDPEQLVVDHQKGQRAKHQRRRPGPPFAQGAARTIPLGRAQPAE